jgi:peptidyl-prolyl cis-trans isomerase C
VGPADRARRGAKAEEATPEQEKEWDAAAKAKAEEVYALATAPEADFAALAREHSTGPSATKGGDLGIFTEDRMVEEFSAVAFKLKAGQVSKPVKTKFGYHIIKVVGQWGPGELPQEALEDQIVERLGQRKLHQGRRELKQRLLEAYEIKNNMQESLGPEPKRRRPAPRKPGPGKAAPGKAVPGKAAPAKAAPGKAASDAKSATPPQ